MLQSALWNPLQGKPRYQYRPRLNTAHPLSQGLLACLLCNEGAGDAISLVNTAHRLVPANLSLRDAYGFRFDADGEGVEVVCPTPLRINPPITIACIVTSLGAPAAYSGIFGVSYNNADGNPYFAYGINYNVSSAIALNFNAATTTRTVSGSSGLTVGVRSVLVAVLKNGAQALYLNGTQSGSGTYGVPYISYAATALLYMGNHTGFSRNTNIVFQSGFIWNRELSVSEIRDFGMHPYGTVANPLFIVEPRYAPWVSVVGGPAFKSYWIPKTVRVIGGGLNVS